MDKRKYRRIDFHAPVVISQDGQTVAGEVENLSNRGLLVKAKGDFRRDDSTLVSIEFSDGKSSLSVTVPGEIARLTDGGVAIHSPHIAIYPILHLEHLFIYHKGKPKQLTEDFCEYISSLSAWVPPTASS